ncbi:family 16 glycosylhydrolase [Pedobacter sp. Leaf176]|uniref:glycoside hydrolase family 16 protein n=1 Tax=Pedobacter sp. Leaf176 TaxID=1736286 RepID=UPI0006FB636C|nr:glycoside hydrolase family 16 protein [Pedobacter sp. Leaf176]KQR71382.1 beta-glucanase [Pedobacter sp. Leaf176]
MKSKILFLLPFYALLNASSLSAQQYSKEGYNLVWSDEFEKDGIPDAKNWTYEKGFVRNEELQWYQPENAFCRNGLLVIEARKEMKPNPLYEEGSNNWRKKPKNIEYTSACLITKGLQSFQYGRFEMRGRINISSGLWPAFWTLGENGRWPGNGEIDIMEYYRGKILANIASLGANNKPKWFSNTKSTEELGGTKWASKFHIWRMDWDSEAISLYVDDVLLNKTSLDKLKNEDGSSVNPFRQKHYILLNLAMGGLNGGELNDTKFPNRMEVDYVRVYQK